MKFLRIMSLLIAIVLAFGGFNTAYAADTVTSVRTALDKMNEDPIERLKAEKTRIQTQLSSGKITQEEADKKIAEIDERIKEQEEFNSLTLDEKKTKLVSEYTTKINQMVKDGKMSQADADKALIEYKAQIGKWDGSGLIPIANTGIKRNVAGQRPGNNQKSVNNGAFYKNAVVMQEGSLYFILNGKKVKSTTKNTTVTPVTVSKNIMVPIDYISQAFGASVQYTSSTKKIVITSKDKKNTATLTTGSKTMVLNKKNTTLSIAPQVKGKTVLVPLKAVAETILGKKVDSSGKIIYISDKSTKLTSDMVKTLTALFK